MARITSSKGMSSGMLSEVLCVRNIWRGLTLRACLPRVPVRGKLVSRLCSLVLVLVLTLV